MKKRIFLFINGVRTDPRDTQAWTDRAVRCVNERFPTECVGQSYEYHTHAILRRLGQARWARELADIIQGHRRAGNLVHVIAHSNGCDLLARALLDHQSDVDSAHLIAAAADDEDYETALRARRLKRLHLYGSRNDAALKVGARLSRWLTFGLLGYGSMGLRSLELEERLGWDLGYQVTALNNDDYGHSTWFQAGVCFEALMAHIAANEEVKISSL